MRRSSKKQGKVVPQTLDMPGPGTTLTAKLCFFGEKLNPAIALDLLLSKNNPVFEIIAHNPPIKSASVMKCYPMTFDSNITVHSSHTTDPIRDGNLCILNEWTENDFGEFSEFWKPWITLSEHKFFFQGRQLYHETVSIDLLAFGTLVSSSCFVAHFEQNCLFSPTGFINMLAYFYHDSQYFEVQSNNEEMIKIQYKNIRRILMRQNGEYYELYFQLFNPPLAFDLKELTTEEKIKNVSRHAENSQIRYFRKLTYGNMHTDIYGKCDTLLVSLKDYYVANQIVSRIHFRQMLIPVNFVAMTRKYEPHIKQNIGSNILDNFDCAYMLEALLQRTFLFQIQNQYRFYETDLVELLKDLEKENPKCLEKALIDVLYLFVNGEIIDSLYTISFCFDNQIGKQIKMYPDAHYIVPAGTDLVRRCVKTPTQLLFWPPEIMFQNRVFRKFDHHYALKVSFRDDNLLKLTGIPHVCANVFFEEAVTYPMTYGIKVQSRHFRMLGWSNSQLREHCVWMYAPNTKQEDVQTIRKWCGDYSISNTISKKMARMGQCFTNTKLAVAVPFQQSFHSSDITGGCHPITKDPYVFSDGVGSISLDLAQKVCESLGIHPIPSAFQVRYKGYKGMLCLNPMLSSDQPLMLRDSMLKFQCSQSDDLEIVKFSKPGNVFLNRPLIMILDQMNIPQRVFLQMQEKQLCQLTDMLIQESAAREYLRSRCPLPLLNYSNLIACGFGITCDPFFRTLLLALHNYNVERIRTKGRLEVDPSKGRSMFGVLDETGTLEYGQVFVQYSKGLSPAITSHSKIILKGPVLVTKNPCLQAGDVQILKAVDVPSLHHIIDCIVFPQKGPRPHPDEMAGSDLDGDEYVVIWKNDLIFDRANETPFIFPTTKEPTKCHFKLKDKEIIDCLKKYISNDKVGLMGTAHLAKADSEPKGIFSTVCARIAHKYSLAVDFAKSGYVERLDEPERVSKYPDFMGKSINVSYKSKRTLGKMYRVCRDFEQINDDACKGEIKVDVMLQYESWENHRDYALKMRNRYNTLMETILSTYGIEQEAEAITGAFSKIHTHLEDRHEILNISLLVTESTQSLWKHFRMEFHEGKILEPGASIDIDFVDFSEVNLQRASAWYMVTYSDPEAKFLGFPWILSDYLMQIRIKNLKKQESWPPVIRDPVIDKLNGLLKEKEILASLKALDEDSIALIRERVPAHFETVNLASKILFHWARKEKLFKLALSKDNLLSALINLIESEKLCLETESDLILSFLRVCISLRHMESAQSEKLLNCKMIKPKILGKKAMYAYHSIGISCGFYELGIQILKTELSRDIEMEPFFIPVQLVISGRSVGFLDHRKCLKKRTGVKEVFFREQPSTKSAVITAIGSFSCIRNLNLLLRKILESNSFIRFFPKLEE